MPRRNALYRRKADGTIHETSDPERFFDNRNPLDWEAVEPEKPRGPATLYPWDVEPTKSLDLRDDNDIYLFEENGQ